MLCTQHSACSNSLITCSLLRRVLSDPDVPPSSDMDHEKYVAQQEHSGKGGSATLGHFHEKVYEPATIVQYSFTFLSLPE
jgi:hypothetical protein